MTIHSSVILLSWKYTTLGGIEQNNDASEEDKEMSSTILVVEDEPAIAELIAVNLSFAGHKVLRAADADQAKTLITAELPDLVLLDWMLPGKTGIQFAHELRAHERTRAVPVIMLTARTEEQDKVDGLEAGADDYITKPIRPRLLMSKIESLLRRYDLNGEQNIAAAAGALVVNREKFFIEFKGEKITLPKKEFELLSLLASKPGKVFKREEILDKVWGNEVIVGGRTIDVHIRKLREKIGEDLFKTIKGVGYKLEV